MINQSKHFNNLVYSGKGVSLKEVTQLLRQLPKKMRDVITPWLASIANSESDCYRQDMKNIMAHICFLCVAYPHADGTKKIKAQLFNLLFKSCKTMGVTVIEQSKHFNHNSSYHKDYNETKEYMEKNIIELLPFISVDIFKKIVTVMFNDIDGKIWGDIQKEVDDLSNNAEYKQGNTPEDKPINGCPADLISKTASYLSDNDIVSLASTNKFIRDSLTSNREYKAYKDLVPLLIKDEISPKVLYALRVYAKLSAATILEQIKDKTENLKFPLKRLKECADIILAEIKRYYEHDYQSWISHVVGEEWVSTSPSDAHYQAFIRYFANRAIVEDHNTTCQDILNTCIDLKKNYPACFYLSYESNSTLQLVVEALNKTCANSQIYDASTYSRIKDKIQEAFCALITNYKGTLDQICIPRMMLPQQEYENKKEILACKYNSKEQNYTKDEYEYGLKKLEDEMSIYIRPEDSILTKVEKILNYQLWKNNPVFKGQLQSLRNEYQRNQPDVNPVIESIFPIDQFEDKDLINSCKYFMSYLIVDYPELFKVLIDSSHEFNFFDYALIMCYLYKKCNPEHPENKQKPKYKLAIGEIEKLSKDKLLRIPDIKTLLKASGWFYKNGCPDKLRHAIPRLKF